MKLSLSSNHNISDIDNPQLNDFFKSKTNSHPLCSKRKSLMAIRFISQESKFYDNTCRNIYI